MPDTDNWTLTGHPKLLILHLPDGEGGDVTARITPDQATELGVQLIQAAHQIDRATCMPPDATAARIDELLAEVTR
jgi:hypothetical protein